MQVFVCTGNLTRDVELKTTQSNKSVCTLSVAVNRPHSDETDFFNVEVWGKQAENCNKFLKKGNKIGVVGYLKIRSYEDKNCSKKYVTEIVAEQIEFLSSKATNNENKKSLSETLKEVEEDERLPF